MQEIPERPPQLQTPRPSQRHLGTKSGAKLWLLRHAEVHEDWQGKAYGDLDVELSAKGLERTQEMAEAFRNHPVGGILSSSLQRARLLAEALERTLGRTPEYSDDLREIHRGKWQGLTVQELHTHHKEDVALFYADPWNYCDHGGESDALLSKRLWPIVEAGLKQSKGAPLFVVSHYNVIRVLVADALGIPPERSFQLRVDVGRAVQLIDGENGWRLRRSNVLGPEPTELQAR